MDSLTDGLHELRPTDIKNRSTATKKIILSTIAGFCLSTSAHADQVPKRCEDNTVLSMFMKSYDESNASKSSGSELIDLKNVKTVTANEDELVCTANAEFNDADDILAVRFSFRKNSMGNVYWELKPQ